MVSEELTEDVKKVDKPEYKFRLSENYAIQTDPRNIILLERYEKRDGKGKYAPILKGSYGWKHVGYYQNFDQIASTLVNMEVLKETDEVFNSLLEMTDRIKTLKKEMKAFLKEKVVVKLD